MLIDIEKINFVHFAGGEVHLNAVDFFKELPEKSDSDDIIWSPIHDSTDLMELLVLTDAYKRYYGKTPSVCIPYIPYARQDRVANDGEALTIKIFADIINSQGYPTIYVMDPHSDVSTALINNVKVIRKIDDAYLRSIVENYDKYVVLAPDAGAYKRLCKVIKDVPLIYATKQRDTRTGALSNVELHTGNLNIMGKTLLVVDDICDGGGTFLLLSDELRRNKIPNQLMLYVTHGIFSRGVGRIKEAYAEIYTTNSFYSSFSSECPNVHVHNLKEYFYAVDISKG